MSQREMFLRYQEDGLSAPRRTGSQPDAVLRVPPAEERTRGSSLSLRFLPPQWNRWLPWVTRRTRTGDTSEVPSDPVSFPLLIPGLREGVNPTQELSLRARIPRVGGVKGGGTSLDQAGTQPILSKVDVELIQPGGMEDVIQQRTSLLLYQQ